MSFRHQKNLIRYASARPTLALSSSSLSPSTPASTSIYLRTLTSIPTVPLTIIWYITGITCVTTTKILLSNDLLLPLTICLAQFSATTVLCNLLLTSSPFPPPGLPPLRIPRTARTHLGLAALFFALGFVLTNLSFSLSTASFTETIKAAEPLTSAAIALLYNVDVLPLYEAISLAFIVAGVYLVSTEGGDGSFDRVGTAVVLLANLCFSARGAHQTKMQQHTQNSTQVDPITILFRFSYFALYLALPMFLLHQIVFFAPGIVFPPLGSALPLLLLNTACFASYNLISTTVLTRVTPIEHAALCAGRRLVAILVTSAFFHTWFTTRGLLGLGATGAGFVGYAANNARRKQREGKRKSKDDGGEEAVQFDPV